MSAIKLHSTYQSNQYYTRVCNLPAELIQQIRDTAPEIESSRYTCNESTAFIRGELTLDGILYSFEVSLGSVDIMHAGYDWDEEQSEYVDDKGRVVDSDQHEEYMLGELMSYACEIENCDVYLTELV